jgi:hypothetical protein
MRMDERSVVLVVMVVEPMVNVSPRSPATLTGVQTLANRL